MKFSVDRESLLKPIQQVSGVVERRQALPILQNLLLEIKKGRLLITGTDLEIELKTNVEVSVEDEGLVTVPARKLLDICKEIPEKAEINFSLDQNRLKLRSGRFRSTLSTLPAEDFPTFDDSEADLIVEADAKEFKLLLDKTSFAMAHQDVRFFLNGMLIESGQNFLRAVATDGHRLALSNIQQDGLNEKEVQVIVPRKAVLELQRLLPELAGGVKIEFSQSNLKVLSENYTFATKLVDGKFPDYQRVIPKEGSKIVMAERDELRQALNRTSILSNEKFRGIRLSLTNAQLELSANNPEQEEAEESVSVNYEGAELQIGFNVSYLQDVLSVIDNKKVKITLHDPNSSAILEDPEADQFLYVVMPMKL
ncbi:MAG: DNA polymerase III subunit beta [Pseudomonadota bacterium]|nr:DNA polymerase III subunit beta [Pseudomonadota bacterium]